MNTRLMTSILIIFILGAASTLFYCSDSQETKAGDQIASEKTNVNQFEKSQLPKLLDLGSVYCKPCKKMAPILDSLEIAYRGKAEIKFIDIKQDKQMARKYGITMIPTQIFFDAEGNEVYRHIGFFPADSITAHFEALGVSL